MIADAENYLEKIQPRISKESTLAEALVWFLSEANTKAEVDIDEIISIFKSSRLKTSVNKTRLLNALKKETGIIKGEKKNSFICSLRCLDDLEGKFSPASLL